MENSLEFEDDEKRESESNWHMGIASTPSFDTLGSKAILQQNNLQILVKEETTSKRRIIPATLFEKLSYYRAFASSPSKTQIVSMQQVLFNKYLWFYIYNVFLKSLPCTYVYVFLSLYAADEHFYPSKMVPLSYGYVWYSIVSAFMAIINFCGYVALLWDYLISGLLYKNPWNRCDESYNLTNNPTCYTVYEFTNKIQNKTLLFETYGYKLHTEGNSSADSEELFQMAPLLFLKSRMMLYSFKPSHFWVYETIVFVTASLFYTQLFKKYIWKILHYCQCTLIIIYLATFCNLITFYFHNGFNKVSVPTDTIVIKLWNADLDVLAESMASPAIVHILSARSTEKPIPSRDSTRIIASNAVYYIFRGLLAYMMKRYCEHLIGTSLIFTELSPCSSFFFWPIYFSYFYLGDYYTLTYFFLNGIEEFIVMAITLHCLIEAITCEWSWMKPWFVISSLCAIALIITFGISVNHRGILYVFMTALTTLAEIIIVFLMYPLGRLIDDITFHSGSRPATFRRFNLSVVPVSYSLKIFFMLRGFLDIISILGIEYKFTPYSFYALYVQAIPFILGALYAIFDIVYRKKQGWKQLFIPLPKWGPKDPTIRRLRNQYDSRQYIDSQAPRELSRYYMEKAELKTYQIDIKYDIYKQRDMQNDVRFEDDKSNKID